MRRLMSRREMLERRATPQQPPHRKGHCGGEGVVSPLNMSYFGLDHFGKLPPEMRHNIAHHLNDHEICSFRLVCKLFRDTIDDHFWRAQFMQVYERPRNSSKLRTNIDFKLEYQKRQDILLHAPRFVQQGNARREKLALEVLRELILDSYSGMTEQNAIVYESVNMEYIRKFTKTTNIVTDLFTQYDRSPSRNRYRAHQPPNQLLHTIQILLAPSMLAPASHDFPENCNFSDSQIQVYTEAAHAPIFQGPSNLDINMTWLLHNLNFWRYHMHCNQEPTLSIAYSNLASHLLPRYWKTHIPSSSSTQPLLGKRWKGAFGFTTETDIPLVRAGYGEDGYIPDHFSGDDDQADFQNLTLTCLSPAAAKEQPWPQIFEDELQSLTPPTPKRQIRLYRPCPPSTSSTPPTRFTGTGKDASESFLADGWLSPLPAQHGIPGWSRFTMMKYYLDEFGVVEEESLWCHEGVVVPGGEMILGRWWSGKRMAGGEMFSGPFVIWCVD